MINQRTQCILLSFVMIGFTSLQLFWNGQAYLNGFKNFHYIYESLGLLLSHAVHPH